MFSCTKMVEEIDLPVLPPPVVVHAYLFPGMDTVSVLVHYAQSIGSNAVPENIIPVKDAEVKISEKSTGSVSLAYSPETGQYSVSATELPILAGKEYFLYIKHHSVELIEASVVVPHPNPDFGIVLVDSVISSSLIEYRLNAFISDIPGEQNFYQLFGRIEGIVICTLPDGSYEDPFEMSIFDFSPLLSDENRDGLKLYQQGYFYARRGSYPVCEPFPQRLTLRLYSIDSHTFRYLESVEAFSNFEGNPFMEPVMIYSNLKNAVGVFGAFSWYEKEFSWPLLQ